MPSEQHSSKILYASLTLCPEKEAFSSKTSSVFTQLQARLYLLSTKPRQVVIFFPRAFIHLDSNADS